MDRVNFQRKPIRSLRIDILVDRKTPRFWQMELAGRLRVAGHRVAVLLSDSPASPDGVAMVAMIERKLYRLDAISPGSVARAEDIQAYPPIPAEPPDLTLDLIGVGTNSAVRSARMTLACDDHPGEAAAISALLKGMPPALAVDLSPGPQSAWQRVGQALPGLEEPHILLRSFDRVCDRMCDLLFACCMDYAGGAPNGKPSPVLTEEAQPGLVAALRFAATSVGGRAARRLVKPLGEGEHWRLGWRRAQDDGVDQTLAWPTSEFMFLPDDSQRFFADPFVLWRDGVAHVLCEEFPYATRKGVISHFTIDAHGNPSPTRVVLERPYHLSYPFLFERDGEIFMIPETSGANTVELYRADPFPDVWKFERVLINNVKLGDATLLERNGLFWIFGALSDDRRSTWDALGIFFAEKLEGPWRPHPTNPVLIDAGCARPAGNFFEYGGQLIRPAQDCRAGYGVGLALCRVDRLDADGYAQSVVRRFGPPDSWRGQGLHTLNRSGPFEVVDTKGWRKKL